MPQAKINGCQYHYTLYDEAGSGETIVFSHGLLMSEKMFDRQVEALKSRYKIVTYDHRGQGKSEVTEDGYNMDELYLDAVALIEHLNLGKVHFVGLSMGGFVGMRLAARRPDLVRSLILLETSAEDEPNKLKYSLMAFIVKLFGARILTGSVMKIMFGKKFLNDQGRSERAYWQNHLGSLDTSIVKAVKGVTHRQAITDELKNITCPTLIMVGTQDVATVPTKAEHIHKLIPHSELKYIDGAGHSSSIEEPDQVNTYLLEFLKKGTQPIA